MELQQDKKIKETEVVEEKKIDLKLIASTIFAVISTLILIYVIYTMAVKKETIVVEKFIFPQINIEEDIEAFQQKKYLKTGDFENIEKDIKENEILQKMNFYGQEVQVGETGNDNPFQPFDRIWGTQLPKVPAKAEDTAPIDEDVRIPIITPTN